MASSSMASAASGFVLSLNVGGATTNTSLSSRVVMFPTKNNGSRLVVRASDEAAAPATVTPPAEGEAAPKPKPPPIGPKRGTKVSYPHKPQLNFLLLNAMLCTITFMMIINC